MGKLIVLEGIDGCGKDTQIALLQLMLSNHGRVETFTFPNYNTKTGSIIRQFLDGYIQLSPDALQALYIANRYEMLEAMNEALKSNEFVLVNRYAISSICYGGAHGASQDFLWRAQENLLTPDYTIILDIPVEVALSRIGSPDVYESDIELIQMVSNNYSIVAENYNKFWKDSKLIILDGTKTKSSINNKILQELLE